MEGRGLLRIILSALVGLGVVILIIVLIVKLFSASGSKPQGPLDITKYADTASTVTLLVDAAPTQIDQDHRQVRITVSQTQNQIEVMRGYQGNVINTRTYSNNAAAYGVFLQALSHLNFTKGNTKVQADYRGYCPFGDRYVFSFNDGSTQKFQYWATSCKTTGTYQGSLAGTLRLIRLQIPQSEFSQLTSGITLGF